MRTVSIATFVLLTTSILAQNTFTVRSKDLSEPLVGATALVTNDHDTQPVQLVSDVNGVFTTSLDFPFYADVQYLGFVTSSFTISVTQEEIYLPVAPINLDEMVVTGQHRPQSARNSVYAVRTISADQIAARNANSIQDVLSNELNIRISRDNATGRSGINFQGLGGQYIKVLIDGVPLTGKGGVENDIDLGQVDIQTIDHIEIVEGPMSVNYGADALAGVINIITRKDSKSRLEVQSGVQSETVGKEYGWFKRGVYSPFLQVGYKPNSKWYTRFDGRFHRFGGWQGNALGRQKDWHPKDQWFGGFLVRYEGASWGINYKLDLMDELITNLGAIEERKNKEPLAYDEEYHSKRFIHQWQGDLELEKMTLNAVFSYTDFERYATNYRQFLASNVETRLSEGNDTIYYRTFFSRNTLHTSLGRKGTLQSGIEATREISGGSTLSDGDKHLSNLAFFSSVELVINKLKMRPGIRFSYNSRFSVQPTPAINFVWQLDKQTAIRWSYGRGFRAPSIRELFHEFIDSNHHLTGNPDLNPEDSHNFSWDFSRALTAKPFSVGLNGYYNDIDNQITFFATNESNQQTTYANLRKFKTLGLSGRMEFKTKTINLSGGFSWIGRYQLLNDNESVPSFLYSPEVVSRVLYSPKSSRFQLSAFYKFNGRLERYTLNQINEPERNQTDGFHTLDLSISKNFVEKLKIAFGVRNLLNVTTVLTTGSGGAHTGGTELPVGYGRSFFLKLNYHYNQLN